MHLITLAHSKSIIRLSIVPYMRLKNPRMILNVSTPTGTRRNGHEAWIALFEHYGGPSEGDKRVAVPRPNIVKTFYKK